jgi:NAD(P)-dependent dehydrogenase (short-subunit alcohol dehydrogenase family)
MSEPRRVVITGATRGLGRAMARRFAASGHVVLGCGRNAAALASLAEEIGAGHALDPVDVTRSGDVDAWADKVVARFGPPDLLLNNAGLVNRLSPLWEVPAEELSRIVDVNVKGVVNVIRAFLPSMIGRGRGVVVNFSSGWGQSTAPNVAPYCATKFAVEGLTGALAQELPPGLAAVPLSPGIIHTDMLETAMGEAASSFPGPEEWAETAVPFILGLGPKDNGRSLRIPFN